MLPVEQFPQFASQGAAEYDFTGDPFAPPEGSNYAAAVHADHSYMRLTKTFDLRSVTAAQAPRLTFQLSHQHRGRVRPRASSRPGRPGRTNWTTLPDPAAAHRHAVPAECDARASCSTRTRSCALLHAAPALHEHRHVRGVERVHGLERRLG